MGALADFVRKKFGVDTQAIQDPVTSSCLTTATTLLRNNPDRLGWIVVNLGTTSMFCAWDRSVSATHGIYVGDTGDDLQLVKSYSASRQACGASFLSVIVATGPNVDYFVSKGADIVVHHVDDLPEVLKRLGNSPTSGSHGRDNLTKSLGGSGLGPGQ